MQNYIKLFRTIDVILEMVRNDWEGPEMAKKQEMKQSKMI